MTEAIWHDILIELRRLDDEQALTRQLLASMPEGAPADRFTAWRDKKALSDAVESLYTGIERVMVLIAEQIDGGAPAGSDWHRRLLDRMAHEGVDRCRPALLSDATLACLDNLRAFRHRTRMGYGSDLDWEKTKRAGHDATTALDLFRTDLFRLGRILELYGEGGAGT